ncbi:MAG: signal peptidase I [Oscillospiraceae bacterium]|nr:signal peptidase I [Oscillospiraceae bacterium]
MKNVLKNTYKITINIILWLSVLLALFLLAGSIFKNEKQLSPWGTGFFTVSTGSMSPAISAGSLIFVREVRAEKIKLNDVLTFYESEDTNTITTHRVVGIDIKDSGYVYITRGDANNIDDPPVLYKNVIGRVVFSLPLLGFLPNLLKSPVFIGGFIIIIGGVVLFLGIKDFRKKQVLVLLILTLTINIIISAMPSGAWWHIQGKETVEYTIKASYSPSEPVTNPEPRPEVITEPATQPAVITQPQTETEQPETETPTESTATETPNETEEKPETDVEPDISETQAAIKPPNEISTEPIIELPIESNEKFYDENKNKRITLVNGWFAEYDKDNDVWYIYDENGILLGTIILPEGKTIEDFDIEYIKSHLIPFVNIYSETESKPELLKSNPSTGNNSHVLLFGLLIICAAFVLIILHKQHKKLK